MKATRLAVVLLAGSLASCATLQQIAALSSVEFALDRVTDLRLAGVNLESVRTLEEVRASDVARVAAALAAGAVPLDFILHVRATNPETNSVDARLVALDWTLFIEDRRTVSGALERGMLLPPGEPTDVPLTVSLDLADYFEGGARDLLELALSLAGAGGEPQDLALEAIPTVETALGPIRYPRPITIRVSADD